MIEWLLQRNFNREKQNTGPSESEMVDHGRPSGGIWQKGHLFDGEALSMQISYA